MIEQEVVEILKNMKPSPGSLIYVEMFSDGFDVYPSTPGEKLHLANPKPGAWGYFPNCESAIYAVQHRVFPSQYLQTKQGVPPC